MFTVIDRKAGKIMAFLGSFLQYVIILLILVAIAGLGIFAGKKLRDRKDAKNTAEASEEQLK